jgi:N-methylhydantoinase A
MVALNALGVDTGGTFTDLIVAEAGALRVLKVPSTQAAPERAILTGVADLELDAPGLRMVHGSTIATNAVLEGRGARVLYVADRGLGDLLRIGRQTRDQIYELQLDPVAPPPAEVLEVGGRRDPEGAVVDPLTEEDLRALDAAIAGGGIEAIAVNLLFSFVDATAERQIGERYATRKGAPLFVSLSSTVMPQIREYERGLATWMNARVGPLVSSYLDALSAGLPQASISVMQSAGGTIAAEQAAGRGVELLLSGPAGGLVGARHMARLAGRDRILTLDMGGTSTDVAMIDGELAITDDGVVGGYPLAVPMVDMHTIGAGGGSIARVDTGGLLHVGPESAGANPGPACYGRGGTQATVTDANLLLGFIHAEAFLDGQMALDAHAARVALERLGDAMGCDAETAAAGVVRLADEHMAAALRVISVERGDDPRDATLISFGGAGGLHVCALADALAMPRAMVPAHAGVLSALGMLVAERSRLRVHALPGRLDGSTITAAGALFAQMEDQVRAELSDELSAEGAEEIAITRSLDLRHEGQSHCLELDWGGADDEIESLAQRFREAHRSRFGHALDSPVELVNLRLRGSAAGVAIELPTRPLEGADAPWRMTDVVGEVDPVGVWRREELGTSWAIEGPALVVDPVASTWVARGWRAELDRFGNLLLSR